MNRIIRHASLFSGIGAPELAAFWLGWQNVFHCEISEFCNTILNYWYPNSIGYENIKTTDFSKWKGKIDVLTGGFPCQPFSSAGQRLGANDNRYLWPEMLRAIRQIQPTFVIGENVAGILSMVQPGEAVKVGITTSLFDENDDIYRKEQQFVVETVCSDFEHEGYAVQPFAIPACAVGAPHQRDRVWFVARRNVSSPAADTMYDGVLRNPSIDESEGEAQRLQERNEIQQPIESISLLGHTPDSIGSGNTTRQTRQSTEGERWKDNSKQGQWRTSSQWADGLHELLWNTANPQCSRSHEMDNDLQSKKSDGDKPHSYGYQWDVTDTFIQEDLSFLELADESDGKRWHACYDDDGQPQGTSQEKCRTKQSGRASCPQDWWWDFPTVSPVCRGNDGLPFDISCLTIPFIKWRQEAVKALGNSMVPQVVLELFRSIEQELLD